MLAKSVSFGWMKPPAEEKTSGCIVPDVNKAADANGSSSSDTAPVDPGCPTAAQTAHLIRKRRSIFPRHMTGDAVSSEQIEALLEAANWAPTHGRTEPWRFVVLGKEGIQQMQDVTEAVFTKQLQHDPPQLEAVLSNLRHDRSHRWHTVSHMIAICMARQAKPGKLMPMWEELAACSCAVQNMHLMATALGVAGYWSSWHELARDSPEMMDFLEMKYQKGDRCWGFFIIGVAGPEVLSSYRSSRGPIKNKVIWKE